MKKSSDSQNSYEMKSSRVPDKFFQKFWAKTSENRILKTSNAKIPKRVCHLFYILKIFFNRLFDRTLRVLPATLKRTLGTRKKSSIMKTYF